MVVLPVSGVSASVFEIGLLVIATWGFVEIIQHAHFTQELKIWLEAKNASNTDRPLRYAHGEFWLTLLNCGFCKSPWVALLCWGGWQSGVFLLQSVIIAIALARLANLANDVTYFICRTPNRRE